MNEDGTMARRADLELFAQKHHLKMGTIEDLICYRVHNEKTVERVHEQAINTEFGEFQLVAYQELAQQKVHLALIKGDLQHNDAPLVRVHLENEMCDLLALAAPVCGCNFLTECNATYPTRGKRRNCDSA